MTRERTRGRIHPDSRIQPAEGDVFRRLADRGDDWPSVQRLIGLPDTQDRMALYWPNATEETQ